ncbi:MAG: hypothetical protein EZS28_011470 [Streblomastix strix]|uniref:Uncharacterized protein n=1 Tax=Streblomastix strix TaxID=222440 RepID=A0A5J4WF31_9EUKA|nr:MAG: hypothetical protein EZS28_011470 [Streblomastix strix]
MSNKRARQTESDEEDSGEEQDDEDGSEGSEERPKRRSQVRTQINRTVKGNEKKKGNTKLPIAIYQKIAQDLKEVDNFEDMEDEQMVGIKATNSSYASLISYALDQDDSDEGKLELIQAGISKALLFLFENWEMEDLSYQYSKVFLQLTQGDDKNKHQLLYEGDPFPGLTRLFDHEEDEVVQDAIRSITNIVIAGYR